MRGIRLYFETAFKDGISPALSPTMNDLEVRLMEAMVKLIVRYPDGLERIEAALANVVQAAFEMIDEN